MTVLVTELGLFHAQWLGRSSGQALTISESRAAIHRQLNAAKLWLTSLGSSRNRTTGCGSGGSSKIDPTDPGRPPLAVTNQNTVFIVESWRTGVTAAGRTLGPKRTVHVYTSAPLLKLELNGKEVVASVAPPQYGNAEFEVVFKPGNLTAIALSKSGEVLATHSKLTAGPAASIRLSMDAPSLLTGTGSALVADGEDTAMVRAELLDALGNLADQAADDVTFAVTSGDGRSSVRRPITLCLGVHPFVVRSRDGSRAPVPAAGD